MQRFFTIIAFAATILTSYISLAGNLNDALMQSAAGMRAQSARMKIIAQNVANAQSTGTTPGAEPYRRKIISFNNRLDRERGVEIVTVNKISRDYKTPFGAKFDPAHPAANEDGYVLLSNVRESIETLDMKEAQRSYEANLGAIETSKRMMTNTIELLR